MNFVKSSKIVLHGKKAFTTSFDLKTKKFLIAKIIFWSMLPPFSNLHHKRTNPTKNCAVHIEILSKSITMNSL